jgi:hypothetical protein
MKSTSLRSWASLPLAIAVGGILALAPAAGYAGGQEKPAKARVGAKSVKANKPCCTTAASRHESESAANESLITGSLIPQKVKPIDAPATSSTPLVVIDRKAIERSGASTVARVLGRTVPGSR